MKAAAALHRAVSAVESTTQLPFFFFFFFEVSHIHRNNTFLADPNRFFSAAASLERLFVPVLKV